MSTTNQASSNGKLGTDDNNTQTANNSGPNTIKQQHTSILDKHSILWKVKLQPFENRSPDDGAPPYNTQTSKPLSTEPQSPSPVSPGKYNINWDEIDESFNPFGSKAGPLKKKPAAVKPTPKVAAVSQSNQNAVAKTEEKTITEKPAAANEQKEPKLSAESASPQDGPPPLNTQNSNPLPDIFADKPLGATAKWDQVDWDTVDEFDDPSKTGTGGGDKLSKKSTGAKPVPTTKKTEVSGGTEVKMQPNKVEETPVREAVADVGVSDTSRSRMKAKPVGEKSENIVGDTNANNDIFADKPLGATAKWDQVDWDTVDEFDDPSKTGIGGGDKLSKKSTGAKPVPKNKKKEAVADVRVSDTSRSRMKAKPVGEKSGNKLGNANANNEQSKTKEEPTTAAITETDSPTSPGKYNINWDEID
ncbi:hypothetical protein EG68_01560, partial [Paragonimus skrjabini miyazakii]